MQKKTILSVVELLSYQNCKMNEITILVAERDYQKQLFLSVFENLMYQNSLYWKSKQHNQKHAFLLFFSASYIHILYRETKKKKTLHKTCLLSVLSFLSTKTAKCMQSTERHYQKDIFWVFLSFLCIKTLKRVKNTFYGDTLQKKKCDLSDFQLVRSQNVKFNENIKILDKKKKKDIERVLWVFSTS